MGCKSQKTIAKKKSIIQSNLKENNEGLDSLDMEEVNNDIYIGIGIKKMKAYKCNLSCDELEIKRNNFWEIKTNPNNKNWKNWKRIHQAVLFDEYRSAILLEECGYHLVDGCINHLIDKDSNEYKIPNYCINDPYYERQLEDKNKYIEEKIITIKFYSYGNKYISIDIKNKLTGKELKNLYKKNQNLDYSKKVRLFIYGIEIKDEDLLFQHNLNEKKPIFVIIK